MASKWPKNHIVTLLGPCRAPPGPPQGLRGAIGNIKLAIGSRPATDATDPPLDANDPQLDATPPNPPTPMCQTFLKPPLYVCTNGFRSKTAQPRPFDQRIFKNSIFGGCGGLDQVLKAKKNCLNKKKTLGIVYPTYCM